MRSPSRSPASHFHRSPFAIPAYSPVLRERATRFLAGQLKYFNDGEEAFAEIGFVQNAPPGGDAGLGPRFNSD
jgi:hypothetical protein